MSLDDFLVDTMETALRPDEVLTDIRVPRPSSHTGSAYIKLERKVGDYAIAAVGVMITLDGGVCSRAGIGLTNVGPKRFAPVRRNRISLGSSSMRQLFARQPDWHPRRLSQTTDLHGPADYKRSMVRTLTARALRLAVQRAQAGGGQ